MRRNPFDTAYMTEDIDESRYPTIFSNLLVPETAALFKRGNVVLMGTQGSGKTMLLNLLKPEIRFRYYELLSRDATAPVFEPDRLGEPFIGCGVNLSKRAVIEFGQRRIYDEAAEEVSLEEYNVYFADFLNYSLVTDLIDAVCFYSSAMGSVPPEAVPSELRLTLSGGVGSSFAAALSESDCWLGGLEPCKDLPALREALRGRIRAYREFMNFNSVDLPPGVKRSKTSAGEPVAKAVELLKVAGAVPEDAIVLVRIDQYDSLVGIEGYDDELHQHHEGYRSVVHKLLALRDNRVFYRIGTRPYGWPERPRIQGSEDVLERSRNYELVDLDAILGGSEHGPPALFRRFAADVFRRRLAAEGLPWGSSVAQEVFGSTLKADEEARRYARNSALKLPHGLPEEISGVLKEMQPLDAQLGVAWYLQRSDPRSKRRVSYSKMPVKDVAADLASRPWRQKPNQWWLKERRDIALLQISAKQQQRMAWSGWEEVLSLSGSNILAFIALCREVWTKALSDKVFSRSLDRSSVTRISPSNQNIGIHEASRLWYQKIGEVPRIGVLMQRFISEVGHELRQGLRDDHAMSYPGANALSVSDSEWVGGTSPLLRDLLRAGVSYGILTERRHSDKNSKGTRTKYHLAPILSPYFNIPAVQTKEPRYIRLADLERMVAVARDGLHRGARDQSRRQDLQPTLFG